MRIATVPALGLALAAFLASAGTAAQDVTLKWTLEQGTTFYAKSVADMDIQMSVAGQDINLTMKVISVQRFKVLSVNSGNTTIEMTMQDMSIDAGGLPGGIPGLAGLGERVKGASITATLDKNMEVTKVTGHDKFLDKLAGDDAAMRKTMESQFSEATIGQMVSQVFSFAPAKPVKAGDTWTRTDKVPTGGFGEGTVKQKFTLKDVSSGVAKIDMTGDVTFKAGAG